MKGKDHDIREFGSIPERIQKILSAFGIASRREAERMIISGRVCINNTRATLGQSATVGVDLITVDGVPLAAKSEHIYLMLNKPCGYITTVSDMRGRKTVMELITGLNSRVYPVGRLDKDTEGLLLFTNDGNFANLVMHPSFDIQKTYEVEVSGDVVRAVELLQKPVLIDKFTVQALSVKLIQPFDNGGIIRITISEGKNRQVRKMCKASGVMVKSLKRISIGSLNLGDLKRGNWRFLTKEEVSALGKGYIASY